MLENPGLIEYLLTSGGDLRDRESRTARQIKRFTDEIGRASCRERVSA